MMLISTNLQLVKQLERLIQMYPNIAIATAWASADTDIFRALVQHEAKIVRAVIGTHFYQTHPDVLDQFVDSPKVKFMLQPNGVFHPKVYLFWNRDAWEVIVGSPNLTAAALTKNSEMSLLVTSGDGQPNLKQEVAKVIEHYWTIANTVLREEADNYRKLWKLKARDLKKVADIFGDRPANKPAVQSKVMSMDWDAYVAAVKKDNTHGFEERLAVLKTIRDLFDRHAHFNDMPLDARQGVAGLPSRTVPNSPWFGSMIGAGTFYNRINEGHEAFSLALDEVPLTGEILKEHYDRFLAEYLKAYSKGRHGLGTATRLLAMKRPDVFLCVDGKNQAKLAEDVGIVRADKLNYERYWDEVVLRLMDSPWWQSPEPSRPKERALWHARAAMLDAIFYEQK